MRTQRGYVASFRGRAPRAQVGYPCFSCSELELDERTVDHGAILFECNFRRPGFAGLDSSILENQVMG